MNRRDFLKVITATAAVVAVPSLIPADAKFALDFKNEAVIGNITRTIDWHADIAAHFVSYQGRINNADYYVSDFAEEVDEKTLISLDANAMKAFKRRANLQSKIDFWKSTPKPRRIELLQAAKMRGDFPPYGV